MNTPKALLSKYIIAPAARMKTTANEIFRSGCEEMSNFIFDKSRETAVIMLVFNALAILSSHTEQIKGLEKSNRENKDFLIEQEKKERKIDLFLTVIPPFILKNILSKKLETGEWTTASAREKLLRGVAPSTGGSWKDDLYNYNNVSMKETLLGMCSQFADWAAKNSKFIPKRFEKLTAKIKQIDYYLKTQLPDKITIPSLETVATKFDDRVQANKLEKTNIVLKHLRNGSAYDELCGQNNGIIIGATVIYTILASNVLMPYLKNKSTNAEYEKSMKEKGETRRSMRIKRRFEYTMHPIQEKKEHIFNDFSSYNGKELIKPSNEKKNTNPFSTFKNTGNYSYSNSVFKI